MIKESRWKFWIFVLAGLALLAKSYLAATTFGTDDVILYFIYGQAVAKEGLAGALTRPQFNLTPLAAWFSAFLYEVLPGNDSLFPFLLKLPGIIASLGAVLLLLSLRRYYPQIPSWGIALFSVSPVALMVDGFHGNLDSILVFLLLLAGYACATERPNWLLCALSLAMAAQVKVVALLLAPIFFFFWWDRKRGWHFFAVASAAVLLGWMPGLVAAPHDFLRNVVGYGSVWGIWGVTYLLHKTGHSEFARVDWFELTRAQVSISQGLKLLIVGGVIASAWHRRILNGLELLKTIAFAWLLFFTFAPGMGMQYMVWFAPFVLVWNARWFAALLGITSAVMFFYYDVCCDGEAWYRADSRKLGPYVHWLLILWGAFLVCLLSLLREYWRATPGPGSANETPRNPIFYRVLPPRRHESPL